MQTYIKNSLRVRFDDHLPGKKRLWLCLLCPTIILMCLTILPAQNTNEGIIYTTPGMCSVTIKWDANKESDLDHYVAKVRTESSSYMDSCITADTTIQILLPDSYKKERIFCIVFAVDSAGNRSEPSREIVCIPEAVNLNFSSSDDIISMEDSQKARELIKRYWNNRVYGDYPYNGEDIWSPVIASAYAHLPDEVSINFSEPVDRTSAEIVITADDTNYEIDHDITVRSAHLSTDNKTVTLKTDVLNEAITYTLKVNNVTDASPEKNPIKLDTQKLFIYNPKPLILSARAEKADEVLVRFNEPLDKASAERKENYKLDELRVEIRSIELLVDPDSNTESLVKLNITALPEGTHTLIVNNVKDRGVPPNPIQDGTGVTFTWNSPPTVVKATADNPNRLILVFSELLDKTSAERIDNYVFTPAVEINQAELQVREGGREGNIVHLITDDLTEDLLYTLTLNNINDISSPPNTIAPNTKLQIRWSPYVNIALNKPASASSQGGGFEAGKTVDGNLTSCWASNYSDFEWIRIDLEEITTIERVVLNWEAAFGKVYELQVSDDAQHWTTIFSQAAGKGGIEDITVSGEGRYIQMQGSQRGTQWGYSLYEFEVYANRKPVPADTTKPTIASVKALSANKVEVVFSEKIEETSLVERNNYSISGAIAVANVESLEDEMTAILTTSPMTATTTYTLTVINIQDQADPPNVIVENSTRTFITPEAAPDGLQNVALSQPATASSGDGEYGPAKAVDGNSNTRWATAYSDYQWLQIELDDTYKIEKVAIDWEAAYGKRYLIELLDKDKHVVKSAQKNEGQGGTEEIAIEGDAKYVKFTGIQRATGWGYSIFEFKVWARIGVDDVPPTLVAAYPEVPNKVTVQFSEPVDKASAETITNYTINHGISISSAQLLEDLKSVALVTIPNLIPGTEYMLTVSAVKDRANPPNSIAANSLINFALPVAPQNIAIGKPVTALSGYGDYAPEKAVDGDMTTRWASSATDYQWITIDLEEPISVDRIVLRWQTACAKKYQILISNDNDHWEPVVFQNDSEGGVEQITLSRLIRSIKLLCLERATEWGYSLYEIEVFPLQTYTAGGGAR
ncbi:discoidin domain-containing protein [candidate division KSB1 bacterium]|nr:discoidin domain-containing protein [candidate division KSB1 bacterium]